MSKALFRFLRGELNGFYLNSIHNLLNVSTNSIKNFLIERQREQLNLNTMSNKDLKGLGQFAGVFFTQTPLDESPSVMHFSESHVVAGQEYSERGLYNLPYEKYNYVHTEENPSLPDINTLATETDRSSLVGNESPIGYIPASEDDVVDGEGNVKPEKILSEPPATGAYSEFYGNQFLFLSDGKSVLADVPPSLFIELLKAMQWIRFNGTSLASLCKLISILCPDRLVRISSIAVSANNRYFIIRYIYDSEVETVDYKAQRLSLFEYIVQIKFKQVLLIAE